MAEDVSKYFDKSKKPKPPPINVEEAPKAPANEIIPINEVKSTVRGGPVVEAVRKELQRDVKSTTRSDRLAAELVARGCAHKKAAKVIAGMLEATITKNDYIDEVRKGVRQQWPIKVEIPDWKTRNEGIKRLFEAFGWKFESPKSDIKIDNIILQNAEQARATSTEDLIRLAEWARETVDSIPEKVEDAEVVE